MKKEILNKIKKGEVKMKPRWKFVAEDVGIKSVVIIVLLGAAIGLSMIGLFWELYNPKELINFGEVGWQLIKEDFPYLWLIGAIIMGVIGWYLEPKIGNNYKRSWWFWAGVTTIIIVIISLIIATLNLAG